MVSPSFWFNAYFYFVLGLSGLVIFLHFFGGKIGRFYDQIEEEEQCRDQEGWRRDERNRAFIDRVNSEAAERDRIRKIANDEIERLWREKQSRQG
jgi:microsomal dipeptidase-like Zn-dependent dipeptidase